MIGGLGSIVGGIGGVISGGIGGSISGCVDRSSVAGGSIVGEGDRWRGCARVGSVADRSSLANIGISSSHHNFDCNVTENERQGE
jgi:hypothetical protein